MGLHIRISRFAFIDGDWRPIDCWHRKAVAQLPGKQSPFRPPDSTEEVRCNTATVRSNIAAK
jgi:hypothetical protein